MADETPPNSTPSPETPPPAASAKPPAADQAAEAALKAAQDAIASLGDLTSEPAPAAADADAGVRGPGVVGAEAAAGATSFDLPAFSGSVGDGSPAPIDLLSDVDLQVKIELGRTRMLVEDVLKLGDGAVIELDKLAGDPVDIYVNERHVARGEVLVLNDNFCVRINEILTASSDAKKAS
ncbi:MAG: flagellar motor switch protein FliN [Phycisphaerales bacterium]|nr:flagellar motor switch protein FliN [Phycisphaerales bacterium]